MTARTAPTALQITPAIVILFEEEAVPPTGEPRGVLTPVGSDVDVVTEAVVELELLAEIEAPAVDARPQDEVLLTVADVLVTVDDAVVTVADAVVTVADVLGAFTVLCEPLTALKGSKSSFKAVPVLGRCWHPSIKACRSVSVAISAFIILTLSKKVALQLTSVCTPCSVSKQLLQALNSAVKTVGSDPQ